MRLKLDENLPAEAVELLSRSGHDVSSVLLQSLGGAKDAQIAGICRSEARVLLTLDLDFADIRTYPPREQGASSCFARAPGREGTCSG